MAYKVFTNGSTLQASEINDNLMRQSVMVFSNSAARTAAITTPLEGMLTWLEDVNRFENYSGSVWSPAFGLNLVAQQTIGTAVSSIVFNNVFSSTYDAYRVVIAGETATNAGFIRFSLPSVNIRWASWRAGFFNTAAGGSLSESSMPVGWHNGTGSPGVQTSFEIINPFKSNTWTHVSVNNFQEPGNVDTYMVSGIQQNTTSFTSFTITPASGTFTGGTISVYGYKKD